MIIKNLEWNNNIGSLGNYTYIIEKDLDGKYFISQELYDGNTIECITNILYFETAKKITQQYFENDINQYLLKKELTK